MDLLELHTWSEFVINKKIMNKKIRLYCSEKTKEWLDKNFAHTPIIIVEPFKQFELHGIKITPL